MVSHKKLGIVLVSSGCAVLVISTIVIVVSLSSIYGMTGGCEGVSTCDTRLAKVDRTVRVAKYAMYASVVFVAGGVVSIVLSARKRPSK